MLRNILTKKVFEKPTSVAKLEMAGFTADQISHIYELPFKLTLNIRLSVFQFKIGHNIQCTKSSLFRDKITDNDKCYLCSGSQTLGHLFVELIVILVKYFGLISLLGAIVKTKSKLNSNRVIFAFYPGKPSFSRH